MQRSEVQQLDLFAHVCDYPGCPEPATLYRQNTQYEKESANWVRLCHDHRIENDLHWEEMWADYWSSQL